MFFKDLTTTNLQILSFNSIRNVRDKECAVEVLGLSIDLSPFSKALIRENTMKKYVLLQKNDKFGIELTLTLSKPNGYIEIYLRRKKKAEIKVMFVDPSKYKIVQKFKYLNDCNENIIKALLLQFDRRIVEYLRNGCSCKNKDLMIFIKENLCNTSHLFNVHIDTPDYFLVI